MIAAVCPRCGIHLSDCRCLWSGDRSYSDLEAFIAQFLEKEYPADVFTGESGDRVGVVVAQQRALMFERVENARLRVLLRGAS